MSAPTLQPVNFSCPETVSEGVITHSLTMKDTDFSSSQKNVGRECESPSSSLPCLLSLQPLTTWGGGVYLTNRFESCNFLKMLINEQEKGPRKHQNADMTKDAFEPVQRDVAYLSAISQARCVSLKMPQAHELLGITTLVLMARLVSV